MMMKFWVRMVTNLEIRKYIVLGKDVTRAFLSLSLSLFFFFNFLVSTMFHYMCSDITEIFLLSKIIFFKKLI